MLNNISILVLRQLFAKCFTNPFPAMRLPEDLTGTLEKAAAGEVKLNPPVPVRGRFRGKVSYDRSICIGCKMCLRVCPANAIDVDGEDGKKILIHDDRCCFCAQCNDICPVDALSMSTVFAFAGTEHGLVERDSGKALRKPFQKEWLDVEVEEFLPPVEPERVVDAEDSVS